MNKKLFTLAAALMMGSAFTVNAQKKEVVDKTALNGEIGRASCRERV